MIKSIRLANWRSHENTELEFSYGTNLLVGIMGSGKTSVLDGISFALFGTFPALERRQLRLEDIPRYNSAYAKVALSFAWNGSDYLIERKIERKNNRIFSKADIYKDNTLLESGTTAVSELVEEILGIDYDLFTRAIYSEQNNIDYFLSLDPKKRKDEFDRILGLDRFEKARAGTVALSNRLEGIADSFMDKYNKEKEEELRKLIEESLQKEEKLATGIARLEADIGNIRKKLNNLALSFETVEKNKKEKEALERDIATLRGKASGLEDVKEVDAVAYKEKKEKLGRLRLGMEEIRMALAAEKKKESELNSKLLFIENNMKEYDKRTGEIEKFEAAMAKLLHGRNESQLAGELDGMKKEFERMAAEKAALVRFVNQTKEMLEHLAPGISVCPLCETKLGVDGIDRVRKNKENESRQAEEKIKMLTGQVSAVKEKITFLEGLLKKVEVEKQRIALARQQLPNPAKLKNEKTAVEISISQLKERIKEKEQDEKKMQSELEPLLLEVKTMEDMIRRFAMLKEIKSKILDLETRYKEIKFDEEEYVSLRKSFEETRIEEQKTMAQAEYAKKERALIGQTRKSYEQQLADMLSVKKKAEVMKQVVEELKIYKNALLETQVALRRELIDAINTAMNEIWGIFYPYGNYKALRVDVTEKDYVFEVLENDEWKPLERVASGGERACAALTLRVALAMVLTPNLSWLVLDEPTHNLDSRAISLLSETLQIKVPQVVKQIFVITHEEALIGADFSRSYRFTRNKDTGEATRVEVL